MAIKAIVFDIGGVLELMPDLGVDAHWEKKLNLKANELYERLHEVWKDGTLGIISLQQVHEEIGRIMEWDEAQVNAYMADIWKEYLGTLNVELADYFRKLRPRFKTAIISNSFAGAREKEAEHYQFDTICDFIIYSHEVGLRKPDPQIFTLACERLGLQPQEVIFVDDHADVYASAVDMGMHCFEFKDNAQIIAEIEACIQKNLNSNGG